MKNEPFERASTRLLLFHPSKGGTDKQGLVIGMTTRDGGKSEAPYTSLNMGFHVGDKARDVLDNRSYIASDIRVPLDQWVGMEQVHGDRIEQVTSENKGQGSTDRGTAIPGTDGMFSTEKGLLLTAFYADCVPLFFYSPNHSAVGLAHAGWRGTVSNIGGNMVELWGRKLGITSEEIHVVIGPAIGSCCYEVDQYVMDRVEHVLRGRDPSFPIYQQTQPGHAMLDLKALNQELLIRQGIPNHQIEVSGYCTSCRTDLFYSHRKEQGKTGRMLSFIGLL